MARERGGRRARGERSAIPTPKTSPSPRCPPSRPTRASPRTSRSAAPAARASTSWPTPSRSRRTAQAEWVTPAGRPTGCGLRSRPSSATSSWRRARRDGSRRRGGSSPPQRPKARRRVLVAAVAALVALAAGVGIGLGVDALGGGAGEGQPSSSIVAQLQPIGPLDPAGSGTLTATEQAGVRTMAVRLTGVPDTAGADYLEVWLMNGAGTEIVALGALTRDDTGYTGSFTVPSNLPDDPARPRRRLRRALRRQPRPLRREHPARHARLSSPRLDLSAARRRCSRRLRWPCAARAPSPPRGGRRPCPGA